MPNVFSKEAPRDGTQAKRSYEEPIPFVPQVDKTSVQKPREIKIPLRQNPAVATSQKVEKLFLEFVETSPEAFCRWRCDTEEYIKGAGINAPQAKIQAGAQLLGQYHKTTWETVVSTVVPGGTVTTDEEVQDIFEAFALNFMDPTARRKQKRYMSSGAMHKPVGWSSRQCASRLSTLNRYLQYLPGTAAAFGDEEMKDMLVDLHSPVYQNLLARANFNVDEHNYLKLTNYLQNLSLIEESFIKNKPHGNSEAKGAHKAAKSFKRSKLGAKQCRKHPHHEHTWDECRVNPKNKNKPFKKPFVKDKANKQEAHVAEAMEVDSDADMDKAIEVLHIEEDEVRTIRLDTNVLATQVDTNRSYTTSPLTTVKNRSNTKTSSLYVKQTHECSMQTPLSRKMRVLDNTTSADLITEVTALIKNVTGSLPVKLHRVLIDTGCSKTLVKSKHVPEALRSSKKTLPIKWNTNGGTFTTKHEVQLTLILPEFSSSMEVQWSCAIDENPNSTYDMIIGRDLQSALKMDILFSTKSLVWNGMTIPMRTGQQKSQEELDVFLDHMVEIASEPDLIKEELYEAVKIRDAEYKKADLDEVLHNIPHLTEAQRTQLREVLFKHESLFEGKLGLWDTPPVHLELEANAKPFHARAFPIPHIHEATIRKEVERLCKEGVLEKDSDSQWAAPTFIIPKKEGTV